MIKTLIFHHLLDVNDLPAAERWFRRYHVPEVLRNHPVSYVSYQAVPPPPGAEDYGCFNYKLHENIAGGEGEQQLGLLAMTPEVVPLKVVMVNLPATPTEDFLGGSASRDRTILRWVTVFRYPDGVDVAEADEWYVHTHAREVLQQPGLTKFFSYRVLPSAVAVQAGRSTFLHPASVVSSAWHRVSEQWYENGRGWVESILRSPPSYTKPAWATHDRYPFLRPGTEFGGIFILETPTHDWIREIRPFYV